MRCNNRLGSCGAERRSERDKETGADSGTESKLWAGSGTESKLWAGSAFTWKRGAGAPITWPWGTHAERSCVRSMNAASSRVHCGRGQSRVWCSESVLARMALCIR